MYKRQVIQDAVNRLTKGKTLIVIAHRLSTIIQSEPVSYTHLPVRPIAQKKGWNLSAYKKFFNFFLSLKIRRSMAFTERPVFSEISLLKKKLKNFL